MINRLNLLNHQQLEVQSLINHPHLPSASGVDDHGNMKFESATGLEDPVDTQFEQPTFEGATRLKDPVDTQFVEQPTFEGAMGLEDPVETQFVEQPTFEGATGLADPVDTQFEQPTFEGATGLEDLGNAPVEPSVEGAIIAQNTGTGSSGGESETGLPVWGPQMFMRHRFGAPDAYF
ncbi:Hypothetical predicted protein [Olea europaea subsp. europaea]|uniref:Uncharacterized protein n=1 Tax=Olea europaea subsp. europaea TaxID=158383 RepID=A0A8S0R6Z7_OLEEU|nr:Hypothetical predicted protein [Olea europaea subsp. europaea]